MSVTFSAVSFSANGRGAVSDLCGTDIPFSDAGTRDDAGEATPDARAASSKSRLAVARSMPESPRECLTKVGLLHSDLRAISEEGSPPDRFWTAALRSRMA